MPAMIESTYEARDPQSGLRVKTAMFWDVVDCELKVWIQYDDEPVSLKGARSMEDLRRENPAWGTIHEAHANSLRWITMELLRKHVNRNVPDNGWIALAER